MRLKWNPKVLSLALAAALSSVASSQTMAQSFLERYGFGGRPSNTLPPSAPARAPALQTIKIVVAYGSEKQGRQVNPAGQSEDLFLPYLAKQFEQSVASGVALDGSAARYAIQVETRAMGSGEALDAILDRKDIHVFAPASTYFVSEGNAKRYQRAVQAANGGAVAPGSVPPLFVEQASIYKSPVVLAMLDYMSDALTAKSARPGWSDILALSRDGWSYANRANWGPFAWGHTHPRYSNSGRMAVMSLVFSELTRKSPDASPDDLWTTSALGTDLDSPFENRRVYDDRMLSFMNQIQRSVSFYGRSTGSYADVFRQYRTVNTRRGSINFQARQPLHAAALYESDVSDLNRHLARNQVVACQMGSGTDPERCTLVPVRIKPLYMREGVIWADHPYAIVSQDAVTGGSPAHIEAARRFRQFLLTADNQRYALQNFGIRPAITSLGEQVRATFGEVNLNPSFEQEMPIPDTNVGQHLLTMWERSKRQSNVTIVFDTSGSMQSPAYPGRSARRIEEAKRAAHTLLTSLNDSSRVLLVPFSNTIRFLPDSRRPLTLGSTATNRNTGDSRPSRDILSGWVSSLQEGGSTRLYDAVREAHEAATANCDPNRMNAIVVLTDGVNDYVNRSGTETYVSPSSYFPRQPDGTSFMDRIGFRTEDRCPIRIFTVGLGLTPLRIGSGDTAEVQRVKRDISSGALISLPASGSISMEQLGAADVWLREFSDTTTGRHFNNDEIIRRGLPWVFEEISFFL